MTAWSPGLRDTAVAGLARLLVRPEWRASTHGEAVAAAIETALHDDSSVVRMLAAQAVGGLYAARTAGDRVVTVGDLLLREPDPRVQDVLLTQLWRDADANPTELDGILERFAATPVGVPAVGEGVEQQPEEASGERSHDSYEHRRLFVEVLTYLAVVHQTSFAKSQLETWVSSSPSFADEVQPMAQSLRSAITVKANSDTRTRAFQLLAVAAESALARWLRNPEEHVPHADLSSQDRAELEASVKITDTIADQIYFASGAFEHKQESGPEAEPSHEDFAVHALPVLQACARTRLAPVVHPVVETLIYLAPLDEKRALLAIADVVSADDDYTSDSLAGGEVIPYLARLLAEQRQLVLFDDEGVAAFRHLLAAFASVGNEAALELAFTFADVFR